ncbi:MAG: YHYH protein [Bacteroidota bacterium]
MVKNLLILLLTGLCLAPVFAQTNPAISSWLRNNTGIKGRHYVAGNATPINDNYPANVQKVQYSSNWVYVTCSGIPAYIIGPYLDGNPSQGTNQNNIYKIPLAPVKNTGTPSPTTGGNIGAFINGVALFDYRDGVSYNFNLGMNQGGPLGGMGNGVWNRDAVVAERAGFDCAKGHPAMGNYHHHQNPSAFKFDLNIISNVCNLYTSDGLYVIDSTKHAPLLGFAYDGFPIYGAYGYKNADGTGGIVRMKSSYSLRNITLRTHYADGTDVTDGPPVNSTYPLGIYREDYQYNPTSPATPDYLDEHNGRFCVTPEYPNGIYCYFTTVDQNWNSKYPYVVGPTFYGVKNVTRVASVTETTTTYNGPPLVVAAQINNVPCFGNSNGSVNITMSGGNPPYTYNWGGGITTPNRSGLAAGTYTVTVTDITAQTITKTISITQPQAALYPAINTLSANCYGSATGYIDLFVSGGTPGYTFLWNDGSTEASRHNVAAGDYSVTITDANNCIANAFASITQPASALSATSSATGIACFGNASGAIQLNATGGTPGYTFLWNDGVTTATRMAIPAGVYTATVTDVLGCSATVSQTVSQPAAPLSASVEATNIACFGQQTGSLQLNANGGTAAYTIVWEDGSANTARNALAAGTYSATVTDANNCTTNSSVTISQPDLPLNTSATVTNIPCFGQTNGEIQLSSTGGTSAYSVLWNDGDTNAERSNLAAGTYSATVTDANQCSATISETVSQPNEITATTVTTAATCSEANGGVSLSIAGGIQPYSYLWNNGSIAAAISGISSGAYTATITDANACSVEFMAVVNNLNGPNASATASQVLCAGAANGAINLNVSGGTAPLSFLWDDGATTQNRSDLSAGMYMVTVQDANNCKAIITKTITQPDTISTTAAVNPEACSQSNGRIELSVIGGTAPYTFNWNNGSTNQNLIGLGADTYTVTITDANACTAEFSAAVAGIAGPVLTAVATPVKCFGGNDGTVLFTVTGGFTPYPGQWSSGSVLWDGLHAGMYSTTFTDAMGCSTSVSAAVSSPQALFANVSSTAVDCFGDASGAVSLEVSGGTPAYMYAWSNGQTSQNLNGLPAGQYNATITDNNGCSTTAFETITQPNAALEANAVATNSTGTNNGTATATGTGGTPPYNFVWDNGSTGNLLENLAPGQYSVIISDANGCTASDDAVVSLVLSNSDVLNGVRLKIFPNPSSEYILVQAQDLLRNSLHLSLRNAAGQTVSEQDFYQGSTLCIFETETLYDGAYFLSATDGVETKTFKVLISR